VVCFSCNRNKSRNGHIQKTDNRGEYAIIYWSISNCHDNNEIALLKVEKKWQITHVAADLAMPRRYAAQKFKVESYVKVVWVQNAKPLNYPLGAQNSIEKCMK
jgi:hypothetical protein